MSKLTFTDVETAAKFCAILAREGILFTSQQCGDDIIVTLTGGF